MAIAHVVTRGFGNGTLSGTIPQLMTRGYFVAVSGVASASIVAPNFTLHGPSSLRNNIEGPRTDHPTLLSGSQSRITLDGTRR